MRRRQTLKLIGITATVGLTGCMGENNSENGSQVSLSETEFEVVNIESGTEKNTASAEFDSESNEVVVTGVISGNNSCYTARVKSSNYDEENNELKINIESFEDSEEGEMCAQSIVEIQYEAIAKFNDGIPGSVDIKHNGNSVHSASFESRTTSPQ